MQENNIFDNEKEISGEEISPDIPKIDEEVKPEVKYVQYIPYGMTPETFEEKKEIRRSLNAASVSVIAVDILSVIISISVSFFLMFLGFSMEKSFEIMEDGAFLHFFQVIFSSVVFTVPFILIYKAFKFRISDLIDFKIPKKDNLIYIILLGSAFCSFANIAVSYAGAIFSSFGIEYDVDFGDNPRGILGFILTFISTAIIPALVEEFAFRGIMLGSLKKFGEGFAVLVSSVLFGAMHGNFQQIPFAFLVGLILGFITVKTKSIIPAMIIHCYNNAVSVIFDYAFEGVSVLMQNVIYTVFLSVMLLVGIFAICKIKETEELFSLKNADTTATESQKLKWVFTSPLVIVSLVLFFITSLQFFI